MVGNRRMDDSLCDVEFLSHEIAQVLSKQVSLCYSIHLEDSEVVYRPWSAGPVAGFSELRNEYLYEVFDTVRQIIRFEKSLKAWDEVLGQVKDCTLGDVLRMDYAFPVFRTLFDLPILFKEQFIRYAVRLSLAAEGHSEKLEECSIWRSNHWLKEFSALQSPWAADLVSFQEEHLYRSEDSKHFRDLHGRFGHDTPKSFLRGKGVTEFRSPGMVFSCVDSPVSISREIEAVDRHRRHDIQPAYTMLCQFADHLRDEASRKHQFL